MDGSVAYWPWCNVFCLVLYHLAIKIKSTLPDIIFGLIDNGILAIMAFLVEYFEGSPALFLVVWLVTRLLMASRYFEDTLRKSSME